LPEGKRGREARSGNKVRERGSETTDDLASFCRRRELSRSRTVPFPSQRDGLAVDPTLKEVTMADKVYKVVEVVGTSEASISKAIETAIDKAHETLRHLDWFEVVNIRGNIDGGKVRWYQVTCKVGFAME
jgi:flavin-binding protein dodecin